MKVRDLIFELTQIDENLEVMIDLTTPDMNVFKFSTLQKVDEIETSLNEKYCLLTPFIKNKDNSLN